MVALLGVILRRPVVRQLGSEQLRGEVLSWGSGLRTVSELVVERGVRATHHVECLVDLLLLDLLLRARA